MSEYSSDIFLILTQPPVHNYDNFCALTGLALYKDVLNRRCLVKVSRAASGHGKLAEAVEQIGKSNREIGAALFVVEGTIKFHGRQPSLQSNLIERLG